ncbi:hypothetical protein ACP6JC_009167 [Aspergillus fumigatus]
MTLMELAFRTAQNGLLCTAETTHTRPNWESWIVVSAKRRAIYTMYLLTSVYNSDRGLPNFVADEMKGVYVPESKVLWEVTDREVWEKEYDRHLLEWEDGMLEISELWRSTETGSTERRERIGRWVRGVDEFESPYGIPKGTIGAPESAGVNLVRLNIKHALALPFMQK